jgi:hypothetical protein
VDCKGAPLTEFVLRTEGDTWENKKYSYHYACLQGVGVGEAEQRATSVWQKRPIYMPKEAYLYGKRGLFIRQKRPIYKAKEAYL